MAHDKQQGAELENEMEKDSSKIARKFGFQTFSLGKTQIDIGTQKG